MAPATRLLSAIVLTGLLILTAMGYLQAASPMPSHTGAIKPAATIAAPGDETVATSPDGSATVKVEALPASGQPASRHADGGKPAPIRQFEEPNAPGNPPGAGQAAGTETITASYTSASVGNPAPL